MDRMKGNGPSPRPRPMGRGRAAAAAVLAATAALQGAWQDGAVARVDGASAADQGTPVGLGARTEAHARLREAVEREAARLRATLDAAERSQDFDGLVRRKLAVDAALTPLHLVRDALELASGSEDCDLLRSLRAEWRAGEPSARWSHAGATERARRTIAEALRIGPGGRIRMRARVALLRWNGIEAPASVDWEIDGASLPTGPAVTARCIRVLPALDPALVGFPLPTSGFTIRWDPSGASYEDDAGARHEERWADDAGFDNPVDLYAVFDGLRLERSGDRHCRPVASAADEVPSEPIASVRSIERADGTVLRHERWNWDGSALRTVEWSQPALSLLHRSPQRALIVTEAEGELVSRAEHRASSSVRVPPIDAELRWADPGTASFTMSVDGEPWAVGTLHAIAPEGGADGEGRPVLSVTEVHAVVREAMASGEADALRRALDMVEALHEVAGSPPVQRTAERELLARSLLRSGQPDMARWLAVGRWTRDLRAGEADAAVERWCSAGERELARLLADASGAAVARVPGNGSSGTCDAGDAVPGTRSPPCDIELLGAPCARFARCLSDAIRSEAPARMAVDRLRQAVCEACARGGIPDLDDAALELLGREARAAAACLPEAGPGIEAHAEERFVVHAVEAAARPCRTDAERAAMRAAWRVIAGQAEAALRACGAHDAIERARRDLGSTEVLVGNRFFPAFDAPGAPACPAPGWIRAAISERIAAAIDAERRRERIADAILDPALAGARRSATPGRIASAASSAAVDEYLRWARETAAGPADGHGPMP